MLPFVLAGAAFVGAALSRRLDADCIIEDNLEKAFNPNLSPQERQKAYDKAVHVNETRYKGESFAELEREEIDFVVQQKKEYEIVLGKIDTALKNGAISQKQHQALSEQYEGAIKGMDDWLNR